MAMAIQVQVGGGRNDFPLFARKIREIELGVVKTKVSSCKSTRPYLQMNF